MKKFLNRPENAVEEMIEGLAVLSPGAMRLPGHKAMIRADSEVVAGTSQRMQATLALVC